MGIKAHRLALVLAAGLVLARPVMAEPGFIGLQIQGMSPGIAEALGLTLSDGAMVRDVALGSPADRAGLRRGDLILRFNGKSVDTFEKMTALASTVSAGGNAQLKVRRVSGEVDLTLTATPWPEGRKVDRGASASLDYLGITMAALTEKVRDRLGLRWGTTGVVVTLVDPDKEGKLGVKRGELILQVNQREVWHPQQVADAYERAKSDNRASVLLLVEGADGFRFVLLPVL